MTQKHIARICVPVDPVSFTSCLVQAEIEILKVFAFNVRVPTLQDYLKLLVQIGFLPHASVQKINLENYIETRDYFQRRNEFRLYEIACQIINHCRRRVGMEWSYLMQRITGYTSQQLSMANLDESLIGLCNIFFAETFKNQDGQLLARVS